MIVQYLSIYLSIYVILFTSIYLSCSVQIYLSIYLSIYPNNTAIFSLPIHLTWSFTIQLVNVPFYELLNPLPYEPDSFIQHFLYTFRPVWGASKHQLPTRRRGNTLAKRGISSVWD